MGSREILEKVKNGEISVEEAQAYFELCLVRLEAYHKWLEEYDAVEYEKAEKALQYYRSARDWAKKFVGAFDNGF